MKNTDIEDALYRQAVEAIDAGDTTALESLLVKHPRLVIEPLNRPSGGYFQNPYLLWFVADNPIRINSLPPNVLDVARLLIRFVKQYTPATAQQQLDYALALVATGHIVKVCGVQIPLINLLVDEGAKPGNGVAALANSNIAAAERLIERGGTLTLPTAVGLNRMHDVTRFIQHADVDEKLTALTVAAFYGNTQMLRLLLSKGISPDGYPASNTGFHAHATPLHQAVQSGSLDCVKLLVEAGANLSDKDKIFNGTPLDWAVYMQTEEAYDEAARHNFAIIENYLRGME